MSADVPAPRAVEKRLVMPEAYDLRIRLAAVEAGVEPAEVLRKAVDLLLLALEKKKQGMKLGFVSSGSELEVEILGL
jgi:hypothetical protein